MSNALVTTFMSMLLALAPAYWAFRLAGGEVEGIKAKRYAALGLAFGIWNFFVLIFMYLLEGWPLSEAVRNQLGMLFWAPVAWAIGRGIGKAADRKGADLDVEISPMSSPNNVSNASPVLRPIEPSIFERAEYISENGDVYIFPSSAAAQEFSKKHGIIFRAQAILPVSPNKNQPDEAGSTISELSLKERAAKLDAALKAAKRYS